MTEGPIVCVKCFPSQPNWYDACKCVQSLCDLKNAEISRLEVDNKILADEVMAWREWWYTDSSNQNVDVAMDAKKRTDASGALMRAKRETDVQK